MEATLDEPLEMTHSSQLIGELDASGLASLKQLAFWSGLHENTVRDYRDGRIKHFGSEMRFWNGVLQGLLSQHAPDIPGIAFRIIGLLIKGTRLAAVSAPSCGEPMPAGVDAMLKRFAPMLRDVANCMESAAEIYGDGHVDRADDPTIAELNQKVDILIHRLWAIKARVAQDRAAAAQKGGAA